MGVLLIAETAMVRAFGRKDKIQAIVKIFSGHLNEILALPGDYLEESFFF